MEYRVSAHNIAVSNCPGASQGTICTQKKPHFFAKEPYISAKQPHILAVSTCSRASQGKTCVQKQESSMHSQDCPAHSQKSPAHPQKSPAHPQKSPIFWQSQIVQEHLKERCKKSYQQQQSSRQKQEPYIFECVKLDIFKGKIYFRKKNIFSKGKYIFECVKLDIFKCVELSLLFLHA